MEVTEASAASRWFGVRAEFEPVGRVGMVGLLLREFTLALVTAGLTLGSDPKRRGKVVLFRRDNGQDVLTYDYDHLAEVQNHIRSLATRLPTTHVFDLCRELGLSMNHVVGPGTDEPLDPVVWDELPPPDREPW